MEQQLFESFVGGAVAQLNPGCGANPTLSTDGPVLAEVGRHTPSVEVVLRPGALADDTATVDAEGLMSPTGLCPSVGLAGASAPCSMHRCA